MIETVETKEEYLFPESKHVLNISFDIMEQ